MKKKQFCLFLAGSKLVHLVPLMFAGMTFTIFDAVANINNNINSNNNNNNIQNINFQQSVNTGNWNSQRIKMCTLSSQAAVVHFNFRAGSTFPVPVCTVPHRHWVNKADNQQD